MESYLFRKTMDQVKASGSAQIILKNGYHYSDVTVLDYDDYAVKAQVSGAVHLIFLDAISTIVIRE